VTIARSLPRAPLLAKGNTGGAAGKLDRDDFESAALRIAAFAVR
jgi:hypothetical protein